MAAHRDHTSYPSFPPVDAETNLLLYLAQPRVSDDNSQRVLYLVSRVSSVVIQADSPYRMQIVLSSASGVVLDNRPRNVLSQHSYSTMQ